MTTKFLYHFNNNLLDSSGNGYDLTQSGNLQYVSGKFNKGILGVGSPLLIYNQTALDGVGSSDFTYELFTKFNASYSATSQQVYLFNGLDMQDIPTTNIIMYLNTDGEFIFRNAITTKWFYVPSEYCNDSLYHHLAVVKSSSDISFYIDGTRVLQTDYPSFSFVDGYNVYIGNAPSFGSPNGLLQQPIDEARFSIGALYSGSSFTAPSAPFVGALDSLKIFAREIPSQYYVVESGNIKIKNAVTGTLPVFVLDNSKHSPNTTLDGGNYNLSVMTGDFSFEASKLESATFTSNGWFSGDVISNLVSFITNNKNILFGGLQNNLMIHYGNPTINGVTYFVAFVYQANMNGTQVY